jgi:hypothetical protein
MRCTQVRLVCAFRSTSCRGRAPLEREPRERRRRHAARDANHDRDAAGGGVSLHGARHLKQDPVLKEPKEVAVTQ